ncbi:endonuclease/exonuclease/phosphatase family protein [Lihuaxuella thermophila]|uniref:Metal-dependent hydrolase, endonuclease/exonuclease/phosphatase family n=1 Tax=Lihuaxuella thermophila TaxID=1173111 RepID=A0A1H8FD36_9BACL|nr:endonuclease/exonuclease/phosphatase family protein [Lihuaxuella thermophila]SEN29404.1 Metal-dependent hydrolase, endonuclease/exonuclease/phosphatase family [Lihuaxuella thermophila]
MKIKVMTFNIHHGRGTDGKLDLNRIAQVVKDSEADLIGLNEVDRNFSRRSDYLDQISWLAEHLQMHWAFGTTLTLRRRSAKPVRKYGNAFLSRYPIISHKNYPFDFYPALIEGRALLEIKLEINQTPLKIFVTHLSLTSFLQKKQIDFIVKKISNETLPVILVGDCNMKPGSNGWKKIIRYMTDVCQANGKGPYYTFPSFHPKSQLDYIFVSPDFQVSAVDVIKQKPEASDHLPLTASLSL